MINIAYFDFRLYWRVSILNTVLINQLMMTFEWAVREKVC